YTEVAPVRLAAPPSQFIASSTAAGGPAMQNEVQVTITGATRGGVERGAEYINVGILQSIRADAGNWRTTIPVQPGVAAASTWISPVEGIPPLMDQITLPANRRSQVPWYDSKSHTSAAGAVGVFMPNGDTANL